MPKLFFLCALTALVSGCIVNDVDRLKFEQRSLSRQVDCLWHDLHFYRDRSYERIDEIERRMFENCDHFTITVPKKKETE